MIATLDHWAMIAHNLEASPAGRRLGARIGRVIADHWGCSWQTAAEIAIYRAEEVMIREANRRIPRMAIRGGL